MIHPTRSARRHVRPLLAALACALAAGACSDDLLPPGQETAKAAALEVVSRDPHPGVAGEALPDSVVVRVVDREGRGIGGVPVAFDEASGGGRIGSAVGYTDGDGYVSALWTLGEAAEQTARVRVDGVSPVRLRARVVPVPATVRPMMGMLGDYIPASVERMNLILPNNQHAADYINAKIALLRTPGLGGEIVEGGRYAQGSVASRGGRGIPVTALFPSEELRSDAERSIRYAERGVPVIEDFLGMPFPTQAIRIWHGFIIGNSGGGGTLNMEDRATYEARTGPSRLPYDPIIIHELSHSYVGNESLAQFLEVYGHNVLQTGSADVAAWTFRRGWVAGRESNTGVHALLDIYRMIGPEAMARAYRAVLPLRPPYGQPLPETSQQAFVDAAPAALKAEVAARAAKVGY